MIVITVIICVVALTSGIYAGCCGQHVKTYHRTVR